MLTYAQYVCDWPCVDVQPQTGAAYVKNNIATPASTQAAPAISAIHCPNGVSFSRSTTSASTAIQSTFITPPTNNSAIRAQQQPMQYAPWRSPMSRQPGKSPRKPP